MDRIDQLEQSVHALTKVSSSQKRRMMVLMLCVACVFLLGAADTITKMDGDLVVTGNVSVRGKVNGVDVADLEGRIVPVGAILPYSGTSAPTGWLLCDGSEVPKEHDALRKILKDKFTKDGKAFVPDLKGRVIVGMGKYDPSTSYELAKTGGKKQHTLSLSEMPAHKHTHSAALITPIGAVKRAGNGDHDSWTGGPNDTSYAGGDKNGKTKPFDLLPPYVVLNYIIKY